MRNLPSVLLAWACLAALDACTRGPAPVAPPAATTVATPAQPAQPARPAPPAPDAASDNQPVPEPGKRWVEGQVLRDGKPRAGADVQWRRLWGVESGQPPAEGDAGPSGLWMAKTDAEGRFSFQVAATGTFFVGTGDTAASAARILEPGGPSSGIVLAEEPHGTLKIRVAGPDGTAVPGARVRILQAVFEYDAAQRWLWAASEAALKGRDPIKEPPRDPLLPTVGTLVAQAEPGAFRTEPLHAGVWHVLAGAPGHKPTVVRVRRDPGREKALEVRLEPAAVVSGKVTGPGKGGRVWLSALAGQRNVAPWWTDQLPEDPEEQIYELIFRAALALLAEDGAVGMEVEVARDGTFLVDGLDPGKYRVEVRDRQGAKPLERTVLAPARDLQLRVEASAVSSGPR